MSTVRGAGRQPEGSGKEAGRREEREEKRRAGSRAAKRRAGRRHADSAKREVWQEEEGAREEDGRAMARGWQERGMHA